MMAEERRGIALADMDAETAPDPDPAGAPPPAGAAGGGQAPGAAPTRPGGSPASLPLFDMAVYAGNLFLLRLALPLALAAAAALRQNGFSLIYLVLLLISPLIPLPSTNFHKGHASRFIKAVLAISLAISIAQLVFQITLLSLHPYGSFLKNCEALEQSLRHLGLVRLNGISVQDGVRLLLPDVLVVLVSFASHLVFTKMPEPSNSEAGNSTDHSSPADGAVFGPRFIHFVGAIGKYIVLAAMCLAGAARPSVPGAVYYLSFIFWATWWAWRRNLGKAFAWTCQVALAPLSAVHVLVIFAYQAQWPQQLLPPDHQISRLMGLTALITTNCEDPRSVSLSLDVEWSSFANPFLLLLLYFSLVFESQILLASPAPIHGRHVVEIAELKREEFGEDKVELMSSGRGGRASGTRRLPGLKYNATGASVRLKKGDTSSLTQDATGSVIWAHTSGPDGTELEVDKNPEEIHMQHFENAANGIEDIEMESGLLEQVVDAIISVFQIITRSSYIATNIIMMAWSITYHSWLTFVLLLWASVLWMIPNQRRSLLHCSPFLVAYAELLLVAQYVYGMDLTDDELPPSVEGINLAQIGFIKPDYLPFKPILIKSLYTVMFWITLRQYSQERWELKNAASAVVGVTAEPFVISVTTATSQEIPPESANDVGAEDKDGLMHKVGTFLKSFLTKFWIWVVAIMLCVIGLGGSKVVIYRIVYMALFLIFVLTFQMSYVAWRKMMYGFWLTVIVYSMLCLVLIYTYQFDNFPEYWKNYTGIPVELQHDIGLEVFDTGALFVRLLTPTFFVIITVIQLHYFHKDFLAISDIRHRSTLPPPEISTTAPDNDDDEEDEDGNRKSKIAGPQRESLKRADSQKRDHNLSFKEMRAMSTTKFRKVVRKGRILLGQAIELLWKFFELHMVKIVFLSFVLMAVYDVCALHFAFVVLSVVALPCGKKVQTIVIHLSSALTSVLFLSKMIYQIEYIRHEQWEANCTGLPSLDTSNIYVGNVHFSMNNADWIGFKKTARLPELLKGYIGLTLVCTLYAVVCTRQKHLRRALGVGPTPPTTPVSSISMESSSYWARQERNVLFPGVDRAVADNDICTCIKFLFNYGFYKFGVEICLITTVAVIGTRMDISSIIYSIWLCRLVFLSGRMGRGPKGAGNTGWGGGREALARVWLFFLLTIAILLPLQYVLAVGLPPGLCVDYPWYSDERLRRLQEWMFLPDYVHAPLAYKLVCDFILLLVVCRQHSVFKAERGPNSISHPGGSNRETSLDVDDPGLNPVPDFISNVRSWLDIVKRVVLSAFFWFSLAIVFLTGTNRVNLFALGYLAGSFIFLWQGNDFYLRPMNSILSWWNWLLGYNVAVIFLKSVIQMLGCVFIRDLQLSACWLVQLLGIACIKKFPDETSLAGVTDPKDCVVPREDTGLAWDGLCFGFLLLQRRLFRSHYFLRVVDETKAQTILASRGAELIEELSKRQISEQQDLEHQVLEKIKRKMERIKATHQRRQETFLHEPTSHYDGELIGDEYKMWQLRLHRRSAQDAIRSGDYFMFEEYDDDEEMELKESKRSVEEEDDEDEEGETADGESKTRRRRFTLSKLLSSAMKTDVGQAADMALMSHQEYTADGEEVLHREDGVGEEPTDDAAAASSRRKSSLGVTSDGTGLARQKSHPGLRSRRSSSLSADHNLQQPSSSVSVRSSFQSGRIPPLSEEEEPQVGSSSSTSTPTHGKAQSAIMHPAGKDEPPGGGRDKPDPDDGDDGGGDAEADADAKGALGRRIWTFMKFFWALIESLMVSATQWLNRFSRDYRYIARCLGREKKLLKEKSGFREGMRTGSAMIWEPRPIVVASWKTRSGIYQDSGEATTESKVKQGAKGVKSKTHEQKAAAQELDWESDDNITEERQGVTSETDEEHVEKDGVPKILIWPASMDKGLDEPSEVSGSPALVSLEALEAEERRKEECPAEEATVFGGTRSPIGCLLLALWYAIISHSELVCYFTVFLHQIKSASLLSIPLPLMVFLWGTLSVPRPSKTFWVTIIAYTEVMVMIKCMFQFDYLPWNQQAVPENVPFFPPRIIGIERKKRYAIYDLTLLLVVFFHRFMLKSLGLWKSTATNEIDKSSLAGEETASVTDSPSKSTMGARNKSITGSIIALEKSILSETETTDGVTTRCADLMVVRTSVHENLQHFPHVVCLAASKYLSSIRFFLFQLLEPTIRVTADVYAYMFMCDFVNIIVVIFGFASFGTQQGDGGVTAYLEENKVPVPFLVMLILQFALMVVDRALFLRKFILGKILFQILLVVGIHIWMFIVLPGVTERQFNASLPPQIWYVVKCIYLLLSAYQIRSGYPTRILGNFLCKKYNYINLFLFKGFMSIPFLFELRTVMDWIWTDTSMTLSDWLKLEDIFSHIFQCKCHRRAEKEYPQPRGQKKKPLVKYLVGGLILIMIIAIIWFPLVLFALGGTVGEPNLPTDVSFELRVGAYQPVFRMSAQNNSLLWLSENTWNSFGSVYKKDRVAQTFLSNYDWKDVAVAKLSGSSIASWTVSPPGKSQMLQEVLSDKAILVTLTWTISRKPPKRDASGISSDSHTITLDPYVNINVPALKVPMRIRNPMRDRLAAMLKGNSTAPLILTSLLPKFLKVSNKGTVTPVTQLMRRSNAAEDYKEWWGQPPDGEGYLKGSEFRDLTLNLRYGVVEGARMSTEWWELGEVCSDSMYAAMLAHLPFHDAVNQTSGECDFLTVYTFNDKSFPEGFIFSFFSGAGIIGLYTSLVILLSKLSRGMFTGIAERIMFEDMPYVDRILQLCLDIYLVRESGELDLEEDLFAKLVFLYRSPETLIKWTRPKGEAIQALPDPDGPGGPGGSGGHSGIARRARPEEDDDDEEDVDDDLDDAAALGLMEDSGAVTAPRAQPERS
ncbi:piezo-type mechanosensitive ion channel component isoform X3 [Ischnura elegans]|uniref:piezo-type mechanosensitive ion channel component isoform X3 n=1 Tax=Ischnura elegans TaxID=197161 RepID=UPI001ED8A4F1|nr:piezo-type mechanosensitive ion channel component isoform X3 [Ischnura elegans]